MSPVSDLSPVPLALYWDFENLHASLFEERYGEGAYARPDNRFRLQEPLVDIEAVLALVRTLGPVALHRGYCNWQFLGRYRDTLLQCAMELVQLFPPGASAKNGADIRLCLDAVEDVQRHPQIGCVVVVSGDSDFMPLAQKLRAGGRRIVGVGARRTTNRHWAAACDAFHYYDDLVPAAGSPQEPGDRTFA